MPMERQYDGPTPYTWDDRQRPAEPLGDVTERRTGRVSDTQVPCPFVPVMLSVPPANPALFRISIRPYRPDPDVAASESWSIPTPLSCTVSVSAPPLD